ncbi:hypothetical protein CDV57_08206 [Aspergillus fumigatus]|nr:hypothetical protein CDV57_08206 [Aspergillus fumigatus]
MHILQLPLEILYQIVEKLDHEELWSLHSCSVALQAVSAPYLFRTVEIRFNRDLPEFVNSRPISPRLRKALTRWSFHVKILEIWADEDPIEPQFFRLLACFQNLRTDMLSSGCDKPATTTGTYCLPVVKCPKNGRWPCTEVRFDELPRLVYLSVSGAQNTNVVCSGTAYRLSRLRIDDSNGSILSVVLACVGVQLEEISISNCDFDIDASVSLAANSGLKSVRIFDSRSSLCLLDLAEIPSTACFDIRIHPNDFERLEDWPRVMRLLRSHRVILSLNSYEDLQLPLNKGSRLWEVIPLRNVQLERGDWLWLLACHRGFFRRKEFDVCAMANFVGLEDFAAMGGQLPS